MKSILVGTGFLGKALAQQLIDANMLTLSTFYSRSTFPKSQYFDLFSDRIDHLHGFDDTDTVIFASLIEKEETEVVVKAMNRAFDYCKHKRVVYISTDAVFAGDKGMYLETDNPDSNSHYGLNKALVEQLLIEKVSNFCIVRPSYVYGLSNGELDKRFFEAITLISKNQPVRKFANMFRSPIEVNELANIIITVAASKFVGIIHIGGPRISIYDFFMKGLRRLGYRVEIEMDYLNSPDIAMDTSLNCDLLNKNFKLSPASVEMAKFFTGRAGLIS